MPHTETHSAASSRFSFCSTRRDRRGRWFWRLVRRSGVLDGSIGSHPDLQTLSIPISFDRGSYARSRMAFRTRVRLETDTITSDRRSFAAHAPSRADLHLMLTTGSIHTTQGSRTLEARRTSKMSHDRRWREPWLCTDRDSGGRWLWRLVGRYGPMAEHAFHRRTELNDLDSRRRF